MTAIEGTVSVVMVHHVWCKECGVLDKIGRLEEAREHHRRTAHYVIALYSSEERWGGPCSLGLCVVCLHIEGVNKTATELVPSPDGPEPMCYQHAHAGEGIARGS